LIKSENTIGQKYLKFVQISKTFPF